MARKPRARKLKPIRQAKQSKRPPFHSPNARPAALYYRRKRRRVGAAVLITATTIINADSIITFGGIVL